MRLDFTSFETAETGGRVLIFSANLNLLPHKKQNKQNRTKTFVSAASEVKFHFAARYMSAPSNKYVFAAIALQTRIFS